MEAGHTILLFREYMGTGLILIWFLLSLIYLFLKEERKPVRILFLYVPLILLLLFFNPLFARVMGIYLGDEIYYRILWLLPVTPVLAYTALQISLGLKGKKRMLFTVGAVLLTVVSGGYIYQNPFFSKAQNLYHVPDSVVHICDAIEIEGREVTAVFPLDMVQYVRQYSPVICMPYGREILVESWNEWATQNELCDAMEAEVIKASEVGKYAREQHCVYIVIPETKEILGNFEETGYREFARMDGYVIYKDLEFMP